MPYNRQNIGRLDRRVTIQEAVVTTNSANESIKTWDDLSTSPNVWAMVTEGKGSEELQGYQEDVVQPTTFRIRYRDDVTEDMRIIHKQHPFYIEGIKEIGRQSFLDITARIDKEETVT